MAFNSCPPSFSTDNIVRFHGSVRNHCGSNDHLAVGHFLSAIERISRTKLTLTSQLLRIATNLWLPWLFLKSQMN
jgi:hypothetical protein